ncbi:MAG: L-glyceraldehyde 3-phosphate reductase [Calditrichaeota bacterium]|nr:L-glyceraldehyde 3-phosphate reductase [Calditrichota bacterium]RQV99687.1 MAG: L-glyceraldehyde 3-phosphate reductase [Calditrichota bacterium]
MVYQASESRYNEMIYRRCGRSGIKLPAISLGLWYNFGGVDIFENGRAMVRRAFDLGITHFDLANNYGPPSGSAEETFGQILKKDLKPYRNELIISSKAGWEMWPGPYGNFGSRKYLIASLDQSLKKLGIDYVDIFYHHRPDSETPLEETMGALEQIVHSGKALYAGISQYQPDDTLRAAKILRESRTPLLIHQPNYNLFDRWIENGLLDTLSDQGIGCIVFSPLAQGILTDRYLRGIQKDSRAAKPHSYMDKKSITEDKITKVNKLNKIAGERGQSMAQMAISWVLRQPAVTSALVGASKVRHIEDAASALTNLSFSQEELTHIDQILVGQV